MGILHHDLRSVRQVDVFPKDTTARSKALFENRVGVWYYLCAAALLSSSKWEVWISSPVPERQSIGFHDILVRISYIMARQLLATTPPFKTRHNFQYASSTHNCTT